MKIDTLSKAQTRKVTSYDPIKEPPKTIPYPVVRTYIALQALQVT